MDQNILKKLHLVEIEILNEVVKICKENNLTYFLTGGTLLGAVRHKGFIPWDDDLDIAMPRADYQKFIELCNKELNNKYFLHHYSTDKNYWLPFAKIRKNNTIFDDAAISHLDYHKGIYIDIFPLDNAKKENSLFQLLQSKIAKKIVYYTFLKRGVWKEKKIKGIDKFVLFLCKNISNQKLLKVQECIATLNKNDNSDYFVNLGSQYHYLKQTINKKNYFPIIQLPFQEDFYSGPNNYDYILNRIYGDYMKIPSREKQVTHNPIQIKF